MRHSWIGFKTDTRAGKGSALRKNSVAAFLDKEINRSLSNWFITSQLSENDRIWNVQL